MQARTYFCGNSLEEAIERDKKRIDPVGEEVIRKAFSRYTASKNSGKLIPEIESVIVEKIIQNPDLLIEV